jgi:hypothetical protein
MTDEIVAAMRAEQVVREFERVPDERQQGARKTA